MWIMCVFIVGFGVLKHPRFMVLITTAHRWLCIVLGFFRFFHTGIPQRYQQY